MTDLERVVFNLRYMEDVAYGWSVNERVLGKSVVEIENTCAKAAVLLEKQVPHIITIQDFINNPDVDEDGNLPAWREIRRSPGIAYDRDGWVVLNRNRAEGWFNSSVIRFWTCPPTKEQSEAVPW